jgi:DNA-binding PadR family transcriptional regulator
MEKIKNISDKKSKEASGFSLEDQMEKRISIGYKDSPGVFRGVLKDISDRGLVLEKDTVDKDRIWYQLFEWRNIKGIYWSRPKNEVS